MSVRLQPSGIVLAMLVLCTAACGGGGGGTAASVDPATIPGYLTRVAALPSGGPGKDTAGNSYAADTANHVVRRIDSNSVSTIVAGMLGQPGFSGDDSPATSAKLDSPGGVAIDAAGNLYIADTWNHCVRLVNKDGTITTVIGQGDIPGSGGEGGKATSARLNHPGAVAVDAQGNVYVDDTMNNRVLRMRNLSYAAHVRPLFDKYDCTNTLCHGSQTTPEGGYQLLTWTSQDPTVHAVASFGHIDTLKPAESLILRLIDASSSNNNGLPSMPYQKPPGTVSGADYQMIFDWIRQGAPNN